MTFSTDNLITAVSTVLAAGVGGLFAWLAARSSDTLSKAKEALSGLRGEHLRALEQVESYHTLEGLYAAELEMYGKDSALRLKTEFRNRVETQNFVRPTMTAEKARKAIENLKAAAF
jgi:hypothetical protein